MKKNIEEKTPTQVIGELIKQSAEDIVKIFEGDKGFPGIVVMHAGTQVQVGGITKYSDKIAILFRGSLGFQELLSCTNAGTGQIHQGFQQDYKALRESLFIGLRSYIGENPNYSNHKFVVAGHSKGSTFVPQTVSELLELGAKAENILAIGFSPLAAYDLQWKNSYETRMRNHINFLLEEDTLIQYGSTTQWVQSMIHFRIPPQYHLAGKTIIYSAKLYPEWQAYVQNHDYPCIEPMAKPLIKLAISNETWCAHMPRSYALTAHKHISEDVVQKMTFRG